MTLDLRAIGLIAAAAVLYGLLPARARGWALLIASTVAIYLFQPALPIRFSDFILPTAALLLTMGAWWLTRRPADPAQQASRCEDAVSFGLILAVVIGLSLFRFVDAPYRLTPSRPPDPLALAMAIAGLIAVCAGGWYALQKRDLLRRRVLVAGIAALAGVFVALKAEPLAIALSGAWRGATGQDVTLASLADMNLLGFSYVAFRLIHTLRDRQVGLLPVLSLREFVTYVIFFPAYTAGPIDRAERFATDLRALPTLRAFDSARWSEAAQRIGAGLLKKFVVADTLAQGLALTPALAAHAEHPATLWLQLYGYALRLYFDFSGYTDIAIGLGLLFGVRLPENFNRPYLKTTLTAFWQNWHMTLSSWARFYLFTPFSRWLLGLERKPPTALIVLSAHLLTMSVIGLWHGVTLNFWLWGVWHALGLFAHKQWSDRTRAWYRGLNQTPRRKQAWTLFTWALTFHYVLLGWVWFALPDLAAALRVFAGLFGLSVGG